jgi:hypothetical protein
MTTQTPTAQPCASFTLTPPQLPGLFVPGVNATLSPPIPTLPLVPCCRFALPVPSFPVSIPGVPLGAVMSAVNAQIALLFAALPTLTIPQCNY